MDSFAALMLATEPPSEKLMGHKPQGKEEPLITRTMWKNMIGHAIFQSALLVWLTSFASGSAWLGLDYEAAGEGGRKLVQLKENTLVFTIFVSLQIFNLFNCRSVHDEWNVFENFGNSTVAQVLLVIIVVSQWLIVEFGGAIMQTTPLSPAEWQKCALLGLLSLPVGYLLKIIPVATGDVADIRDPRRTAVADEGAAAAGGAGAAGAVSASARKATKKNA
jgi:magnesium-transporting ATPase (P-type)